ncbi:hypothetical protein SLS55_005134 [Diplodia seriata]|uniref:XPG-I domain-containing protein n=1 Tax=Diplodia seriata TaxID=420778 RepID=A0ABR3CFI7_9PEZI
MGIWDVLGDGELTSIAQLASDHFQRTGRPLRVAVDEAGWRFCNLNPHQVKAIRQKEPAANPVEKAILYRILKLLKLNIQLLFVFDGPRRPWKKGKTAGMIKYQDIKTLRHLLDLLRVPHHRAPAEAEAECVRLQQEGIVDAVWSEDSDSLMFGCTMLIRNFRDKDKKSDTHVRVHRAHDLWEKKQLNRDGLVLIAMLAGGDYDPVGVRGCGANMAYNIAKRGLGTVLCQTPDRELLYFRDKLHPLFRGKDVEIPFDWPKPRHLNNYRNPTVSSREELHDLNALRRNGWDREIDQPKLRTFLQERFQIWTKGYMKHIAPVLLVRNLCKPTLPTISNPYSIEIVRSKKQSSASEGEDAMVRKIRFLPHGLVSFDFTVAPEEEDWSKLATKSDGEFDPASKIECEVLETVLRSSLPTSVLEAPAPARSTPKRKRSAPEHDSAVVESVEASSRPSSSRPEPDNAHEPRKRTKTRYTGSRVPIEVDKTVEKMMSVRRRNTVGNSNASRTSDPSPCPVARPRPVLHTLPALPEPAQTSTDTAIVDLGSESEDELPAPSEIISSTRSQPSASDQRRQYQLRPTDSPVPVSAWSDDDARKLRELQANASKQRLNPGACATFNTAVELDSPI